MGMHKALRDAIVTLANNAVKAIKTAYEIYTKLLKVTLAAIKAITGDFKELGRTFWKRHLRLQE